MEYITNRLGFIGFADSRIGGRTENQDDYGFAETPLGLLVVVCDGMGGGPAGKTASSYARETIINHIKNCKTSDNPKKVLADAVSSANSVLLGMIKTNAALRGMGTTCVAVLLNKKSACIVHVGDSRCYILRNNKTLMRTVDHSYVAEMVRKGELTEEQARQSSHSNVITRAIGIKPTVEPEIDCVNIKPGDRIALMSDGIWGNIQEEHLINSLCQENEIQFVVTELADRVDAIGHNNGGQHDNLTLAVLEYPAKSKKDASITNESHPIKHERKKFGMITLILPILLISLGINLYFILRQDSNDRENIELIDKLEKITESLRNENRIIRDSIAKEKETISENDAKDKNIIEQIVSDDILNAIDNPQSIQDEKIGQVNNPNLMKTIQILKQLDTLGHKQEKNIGKVLKDKIIKKRTQLRTDAAASMMTASKDFNDAQSQKAIIKLCDAIKRNNKLTEGIDSKGRPTKETKDTIKYYIQKINSIKK